MPTTFIGLVLFVGFLTPGFLYTSHRRRLVPRGDDTPIMEVTSIVSISLVTNGVVFVGMAIVSKLVPDHTPDLTKAIAYGSGYWLDNLAYMLAWSGGALALSCLLAVLFARCEPIRRAAHRVRLLGCHAGGRYGSLSAPSHRTSLWRRRLGTRPSRSMVTITCTSVCSCETAATSAVDSSGSARRSRRSPTGTLFWGHRWRSDTRGGRVGRNARRAHRDLSA